MRNKKTNDCSLLPYFRENVYGLDSNSCQILGWEIIKFKIQEEWKFSTGENTKIAVIDTGCDINHPDIKTNLLVGKNFLKKGDPIDDNGHGTHVCGTIAAKNNGIGIVGVAPDAKIVPIKALDSNGNGNNETIAKAIIWAVDNGVDFITMSLGSPYGSISLEKSIEYAKKKNVVLFCAAGNSGESVDIMYPAKYESTIAIGSINQSLKRSIFTCSGESLDFMSPGENILSCTPNNNYSIMSGTSMANPFAVGCASLILSYAKKHKIKFKHCKETYINLFEKTCIKNTGAKKLLGYGIIQPVCSKVKKLT